MKNKEKIVLTRIISSIVVVFCICLCLIGFNRPGNVESPTQPLVSESKVSFIENQSANEATTQSNIALTESL